MVVLFVTSPKEEQFMGGLKTTVSAGAVTSPWQTTRLLPYGVVT